MRGASFLLGALIALSVPSVQADGSLVKCAADSNVCVIVINVDMSQTPCVATGPGEVEVPSFLTRGTWLLFVLVGGDASVSFATTDAIKFKANGDQGTPWGDHFDSPSRRHPRVVLVYDKNPWFKRKAEKFEYEFAVTPCKSVDPLIHNTN